MRFQLPFLVGFCGGGGGGGDVKHRFVHHLLRHMIQRAAVIHSCCNTKELDEIPPVSGRSFRHFKVHPRSWMLSIYRLIPHRRSSAYSVHIKKKLRVFPSHLFTLVVNHQTRVRLYLGATHMQPPLPRYHLVRFIKNRYSNYASFRGCLVPFREWAKCR